LELVEGGELDVATIPDNIRPDGTEFFGAHPAVPGDFGVDESDDERGWRIDAKAKGNDKKNNCYEGGPAVGKDQEGARKNGIHRECGPKGGNEVVAHDRPEEVALVAEALTHEVCKLSLQYNGIEAFEILIGAEVVVKVAFVRGEGGQVDARKGGNEHPAGAAHDLHKPAALEIEGRGKEGIVRGLKGEEVADFGWAEVSGSFICGYDDLAGFEFVASIASLYDRGGRHEHYDGNAQYYEHGYEGGSAGKVDVHVGMIPGRVRLDRV
jgi:hypothetical protein